MEESGLLRIARDPFGHLALGGPSRATAGVGDEEGVIGPREREAHNTTSPQQAKPPEVSMAQVKLSPTPIRSTAPRCGGGVFSPW